MISPIQGSTSTAQTVLGAADYHFTSVNKLLEAIKDEINQAMHDKQDKHDDPFGDYAQSAIQTAGNYIKALDGLMAQLGNKASSALQTAYQELKADFPSNLSRTLQDLTVLEGFQSEFTPDVMKAALTKFLHDLQAKLQSDWPSADVRFDLSSQTLGFDILTGSLSTLGIDLDRLDLYPDGSLQEAQSAISKALSDLQ